MSKDRVKRERTGIYFDCICGSTSAIISLFAIIFVVLTEGTEAIEVNTYFIISLTFWIFWLIFSLSILGYGIYKFHEEKDYKKWKAKMEKKKKVRTTNTITFLLIWCFLSQPFLIESINVG